MDEKLRILLCEDDENLGMLLREYLQAKGYNAELCPDGDVGYKTFLKNKFDLCVLDVMMPKKDGFTLAQEIRQANAQIPIIFLTAKTLKEDILEGFKIGADDYITKPFSVLELIARIKTSLRRANLYVTNQEGFVVDNNVYKVFYEGKDLGLTLKEFKLLKLLIGKAGVTVEREELFREVWGEGFMGETRTLDMHIAQVRDKIKECGGDDVIVTVRGIGYRFDVK